MSFSEVEEAFENASEALRELQNKLRASVEPCFTSDAKKGSQSAWDDRIVLRQLNKELRELYWQTSAVIAAVGATATKPKRDQAGRHAERQERLAHYRRG